jgi:hypothetical protein
LYQVEEKAGATSVKETMEEATMTHILRAHRRVTGKMSILEAVMEEMDRKETPRIAPGGVAMKGWSQKLRRTTRR